MIYHQFLSSVCNENMVLTPEQAARVVALIEDGRSMRYVARLLNVNVSTIQRTYQRYRELGTYSRRHGSGRRRATSDRDDQYLRLQVLRNRHTTAVEARNRLQQATGVNVSERTVRRRLRGVQLFSRRPATGPRLEPLHRRARLHFALLHQQWTQQQWQAVLFTDEKRFGLRSPDGRERVWRRAGERFSPITFSSRTAFDGGSVMAWAGVSTDARTELYVIENGTLTADRYIMEVLENHVVPFAPFVGDGFYLIHDNARAHTARCVQQYLHAVGINTLNWPARSPDLNPIEHVWDMLARNVRQRAPETLQQLRVMLHEEWERIPQESISRIIASMAERLREVIRAGGGNTRF